MNPSTEASPTDVQETGTNSEDPFSPGPHPLALLLGPVIGILSLAMPLMAVMAGRPAPSDFGILHGSSPPTGFPSARAGEPGGGQSGRLPQ